jgi:hypothetical protein
MGCGLLTTPGKVWMASGTGFVDVLDAEAGQVLQSIALFPGAGGLAAQPVFDLKFDRRQVWAWTNSAFTIVSLMVTDDPQGGTDVTVVWTTL